MTILVGALCTDGVVIGSDSSTTLVDPAGRYTVQQPDQKVFVVEDEVLFAASGDVGLTQRLREVTGQTWKKCKRSSNVRRNPTAIATANTNAMRGDLQNTGLQVGPNIQPPRARAPIGALMAFPADGRVHLYEHPIGDLQPTKKTVQLWHVSMGSGQILCDPFLGYLRRIFWSQTQPSLSEGLFAVAWALHFAIELNTGGIDGPIQIATLIPKASGMRPDRLRKKRPRMEYEARLLKESELGEHIQKVQSAEQYLSRLREEWMDQVGIENPPLVN